MADEKAKILLELGIVEDADSQKTLDAIKRQILTLEKEMSAGRIDIPTQRLETLKKLEAELSKKVGIQTQRELIDLERKYQSEVQKTEGLLQRIYGSNAPQIDFSRVLLEEMQALNPELSKIAANAAIVQKRFAEVSREVEILRQRAAAIDRISNALAVVGTTIVAGLYISAQREAQRIKEAGGIADETTTRWLKAQDRIQRSYQIIGSSAEKALLPVLEKAASLAEKVAKYAEANPEVIKAVLNFGAALVVLGTVGKAIAGGIRMYADFKLQAAAAQMVGASVAMEDAANKMLTAAGITTAKTGGGMLFAPAVGGTTTTTTAGTLIGSALVYAIAAYVGAKGGEVLGNALGDAYRSITGKGPGLAGEGKYSAGDAAVGTAMLLQGAFYKLNEIMGASEQRLSAISVFFTKVDYAMAKLLGADRIKTVLEKLSGGILDLGDSAEDATGKISGTANALQALGAYTAYVQANAEANAQYAADKAQIESTYTQQTETLYKNHAAAMAAINSSLAATLSSIEANYQAANIAAQAQYQADQASIIAQGAAQVEQIIADSQERLAEMARDHAQRVEELTNDRDALGLAQENRRYKEEVAAEKARAQQAVAQAKKQTQQQLAELERRFQLEQQQRDQQYQLEVDQAHAQAAQQLAEENAAFQAQLAQLQAAKEAELKQLEDAHKKELAENRRTLIQKLHDLGYYSQKELETARAYQATMLAELDAFWAAYADIASEGMNSISGASGTAGIDYSVPGYASGGYKYAGIYRVETGKKEFVLNDSATRAAESMIGSRLSQENMLASMFASMGGGGYGNQMVNVNVAQGATLMQVKRKLDQNSRELSRNLEKAFRSI